MIPYCRVSYPADYSEAPRVYPPIQPEIVIKGRCALENKGEVCLEEEVERMRRSGMSTTKIAQKMGVDPGWVESLVSMWEGGGASGEKGER